MNSRVKVLDYPIVVKADFTDFISHYGEYGLWSSIPFLNSYCVSTEYKNMNMIGDGIKLFAIIDSHINTLIVRFEIDVSVEDKNNFKIQLNIKPNPVNDLLTIYGMDGLNGSKEILNVPGMPIMAFKINGTETQKK